MIVLPYANHSLQVGMQAAAAGHGSRGEDQAAPTGRGYLEEIEDWVERQGITVPKQ